MKLNVLNFGIAAAVSGAGLWLVRTFVFFGMGGWGMMIDRPMMAQQSEMGPQMMRQGWTSMGWSFSWPAAAGGIIFWAVSFGVFAAIFAWTYNKLEARVDSSER
jgi:hypothetical protein